jgi:hypothetical protein
MLTCFGRSTRLKAQSESLERLLKASEPLLTPKAHRS